MPIALLIPLVVAALGFGTAVVNVYHPFLPGVEHVQQQIRHHLERSAP
jgi:hypothetical protein